MTHTFKFHDWYYNKLTSYSINYAITLIEMLVNWYSLRVFSKEWCCYHAEMIHSKLGVSPCHITGHNVCPRGLYASSVIWPMRRCLRRLVVLSACYLDACGTDLFTDLKFYTMKFEWLQLNRVRKYDPHEYRRM